MDPALAHPAAPAPVTFGDGLGERHKVVDRARNEPVEVFRLRGELTSVPAFEFALRERVSRLSSFRHPCYAHVRSVERLKDPVSTLALVSDVTAGVRLSELLAFAERAQVTLDIDAALCLLRQLVPAVAMLQAIGPEITHGALAAERIMVTPGARVIIVEHVMGPAIEQLRFTRERYWQDLRIALPHGAGAPKFDHRVDVTQLGAVALSLILGRPCSTMKGRHAWATLSRRRGPSPRAAASSRCRRVCARGSRARCSSIREARSPPRSTRRPGWSACSARAITSPRPRRSNRSSGSTTRRSIR